MLTAKDISEKVFTVAAQGFDQDEVDDFLDEVMRDYVALTKENRTLKQLLEAKEAELAAAASAPAAAPAPVAADGALIAGSVDKPGFLHNLEITLRETLASAERIKQETIAEATQKSEALVNEAQTAAKNTTDAANAEAEATRKEVASLKQAAEDYRTRFLRLVQDQAHVLKAETSLFE